MVPFSPHAPEHSCQLWTLMQFADELVLMNQVKSSKMWMPRNLKLETHNLSSIYVDVENVSEDSRKLLIACLEHTAGDAIGASSLKTIHCTQCSLNGRAEESEGLLVQEWDKQPLRLSCSAVNIRYMMYFWPGNFRIKERSKAFFDKVAQIITSSTAKQQRRYIYIYTQNCVCSFTLQSHNLKKNHN